jgi:phosphatidylglycerophosphatase A
MSRMWSIFFGVGLLRPAPGTWGSLVAVLLAWAIDRYMGFPALLVAFLAITAIAYWAISAELADRPGADPGEIVIDEVAGQWLALLFPAAVFWWHGWEGWLPYPAPLAAFALFRLFDIWKPSLIGRADARGDAAGVLYDDLWAGLFSGVCALVAAGLIHGVLLQ